MIETLIMSIIVFVTSNQYVFNNIYRGIISRIIIAAASIVYLVFVFAPKLLCAKKDDSKEQMRYNARIQLRVFFISAALTVLYAICLITIGVPFHNGLSVSPLFFGMHIIIAFLIELILLLSGIIRLCISHLGIHGQREPKSN